MGGYANQHNLTVLNLQGFGVVLGQAWLQHRNPAIHWARHTFVMDHHGVSIHMAGDCSLCSSSIVTTAAEYMASMLHGEECFLAVVHNSEACYDVDGAIVMDVKSVLNDFRYVLGGLPGVCHPSAPSATTSPWRRTCPFPKSRIYPVNAQQHEEQKPPQVRRPN